MARISLVAAVAFALTTGMTFGQEESQSPAPAKPQWYRTHGELTQLPSDPQQWINCPPLSLEQLEGKGIVLYYFEETCPNCEKRWPALLEAAAQQQDQPVVFIAVNSGNTPQQLAGYLKRNNIDWPVIVDVDRSFEKQSLGQEISLDRIAALCTRTAEGEWHAADAGQLGAVAAAAAEGGRWRVDPAGMPDELRGAWAAVELGNYQAASPVIMRAGRKGDAETKAAAKQLFAAVETAMDADLAGIQKHLAAGEHWQAYKGLERFMQTYEGYPMHPAVQEKHKEVSQMEVVKNEQNAAKKLAAAIRAGSANTPKAVKRAVGMLTRVVEDYPGTEAAAEAAELLEQVAEANGGERA